MPDSQGGIYFMFLWEDDIVDLDTVVGVLEDENSNEFIIFSALKRFLYLALGQEA